jgi:hypothetical protein
MRIRILIAVGALCLGVSPRAEAVPVDPGGTVGIVVEHRAPGSLYWDLYLFSAPGAEVSAVAFTTQGFTAFTFEDSVANVNIAFSIFIEDAFGDGRGFLWLEAWYPLPLGGTDDLNGLLLGTFTATLPTLESVAVSVDSGTPPAYHGSQVPYPVEDVVLALVPEANAPLALLALAAFAALRLRPSQHLAG